jgi:hypothetical protein
MQHIESECPIIDIEQNRFAVRSSVPARSRARLALPTVHCAWMALTQPIRHPAAIGGLLDSGLL